MYKDIGLDARVNALATEVPKAFPPGGVWAITCVVMVSKLTCSLEVALRTKFGTSD